MRETESTIGSKGYTTSNQESLRKRLALDQGKASPYTGADAMDCDLEEAEKKKSIFC